MYETLGMRIYRDEFREVENSSDEEAEDPLLPIDYALMYGDYKDQWDASSPLKHPSYDNSNYK